MSQQPTTAALVTAPARGGIAVIVLSGPRRDEILKRLFCPRGAGPAEGGLSLGWIVTPDTQEKIDEAVVALTPLRAEINIHGGPHVARRVLTLLKDSGAEILSGDACDPMFAVSAPGLDNPAVAAEMLFALRRAQTPLAASAITQQWSAGLSALAQSLLAAKSSGQVAQAAVRLRSAAEALPLMKRLLNPAEVVIAGPPNAGKSSLANTLVGRDVSIVSDTPGTTRDWVRHLADADGVPIWLTDTAGLWEADEAEGVDAEAVRRAWQRVDQADLVICLLAGQVESDSPLVQRLRREPNVVNVSGKSDVIAAPVGVDLAVSARTMAGVGELRRLIRARLGFTDLDPTAAMAFTDRQARLLLTAAAGRGDVVACRAALAELLRGKIA